jgi:ATP-binding cassette subfamily B protein
MQANRVIQRALQLRAAVAIVWRSGRLWTIANGGLLFIQGILPLASLYLMKLVLDMITERLDSAEPSADFERIAVLIGLAGVVALVGGITNIAARLVNEAQGEAVTDYVKDILHAKSIEVDLEYYENADYYDKLHRAQQEALYRPVRIVNGLMQVGQNGIAVLAMAGLLLSLHWAVSLVLFATAVPGVLVRLRYARILFRWRRTSTPAERQAWYYDWMLVSGEHAKEIRLFKLGRLFIERFHTLRQQLRRERLEISTRRSLAELVTQLSSTAAMFGSYAFIAYRTLQGAITLGDLVMYYQAFQRGQSFLTEMLRSLAGLYEDSLFLAYLDEFLALEPKVTAPPTPQPVPRPMRSGITFHDVTFRYPRSPNETLAHINLAIGPGDVVALVGANGAGKTTLVKILCRLYDPTLGRVTIDGIDLAEFDPVALRSEISLIFQDYQHYNINARENIWFGNIDLPLETEDIMVAAQKSGAHADLERLPQGYDTILGKVFQEGEELSIGQWQKIALARAFLRDSQIIVLDEPTSALDALAEYEIFTRFRELIGSRSALLISHRLSTVRMADRIYVLDNNTVAEHGTHDELMQQDGIYARLFNTQAENYL